jgi:2-polyprenyl-6-methoxyphenol hydroxylase-like FAD-dependent oxidoreductase
MIPEKTQVLIIGAGPTGLMLANQLARRGVVFVIVDRHAGPSVETRALGVQARTLEIYSQLGIVDQALKLGKPSTGGNIWVKGRVAAKVPLVLGRDLSPYPFILILGQDDNERLLGELLAKQGHEIQWNSELTGIIQQDNQAIATIKQANSSSREIHARWVAGCDGAHSAVRNLNKIDFPGAPYEHVFYVADVTATGSMVPSELNVYLFRDGFHLFFPMGGENHWRFVGILPPELRERENLEFNDVMPSIMKQTDTNLAFQECRWFSKYRIHHRCAARFRDRRCFLLGDAAHIHSPVGAQGMNTGLQDAYNLGWKLAFVAKGNSDEALVDLYEAERLPVAKSLLNGTDKAFSIIVSDSWISGFFRTRVMAKIASFAMRFARVQILAFRTISQIGIQYRSSSISQTLGDFPDEAPQAGDRFPWLHLKFSNKTEPEDVFTRLDDKRINLILIGQTPPSNLPPLDGLLSIHEVVADSQNDREFARAHIPNPSFYLLRPDLYIGLAGRKFDAGTLARYLSERLRFRSTAGILPAEAK